jgi:hypothetical protein
VITQCSEILKLIVWQVDQNGNIERVGDSGDQGGLATRVSCAHIGGKWATAVRYGHDVPAQKGPLGPLGRIGFGQIKVTFWDQQGGGLTPIGDSGITGINVIDVQVAGLDFNDVDFGGAEVKYRVFTAVRTSNQKLRVMIWSWKPSTGKVELISDSGEQPEPISLLRIMEVGNNLFITCVRDDSTRTDKRLGHLKLITWSIK